MNWKSALVLSNSALRGAVSLALALITELHKGVNLQSRSQMSFQVCMMVLLTIIVNGSIAKPLLTLLDMNT
jgi:NhaP-type Na+/H+ or K+/H+ antiporter